MSLYGRESISFSSLCLCVSVVHFSSLFRATGSSVGNGPFVKGGARLDFADVRESAFYQTQLLATVIGRAFATQEPGSGAGDRSARTA